MNQTEEPLCSSWVEMVRHYDDLLQRVGWDYLRPFRDIVEEIACSEWAVKFLAGHNPEHLVIELPGSWPVRRVYAKPSVGVVSILRVDGVRVSDEVTVPIDEARGEMLRSFEWLIGKERLPNETM